MRRIAFAVLAALALTPALGLAQNVQSPPAPPGPVVPLNGDAQTAAIAAAAAQNSAPVPSPLPGATTIPGDAYWSNMGTDALRPSSRPPQSVEDVMSGSILKQKAQAQDIPFVRAQAIQTAAAAYGAQAGMSARAHQLNEELRSNAGTYDRVFNFSAVMLEPGFLPPVISEGRDAYNQPSATQVRAADRIFKIEYPARLVNVPPRWQDYLFVTETVPVSPDRTVLPKTAAEKALWDEWAAKGWSQGQAMAEETCRSNIGRLRRDFSGMLLYKTLYAQGLVTKPILAKTNLGVTGGEDEMALGDRIYEVTRKASLNPDRSRWSTPVPRTDAKDPVVPASNPGTPSGHPSSSHPNP